MIVSITHEHDLDGLGSQAIIKRYFDNSTVKEEMEFLDATYSNFVDVMKTLFNSNKSLTQLIISDIGFNKSFNVLFKLFKVAKKTNCRILWFDHHIVDVSVKRKISKLIDVYINDIEKCAAEITKDYFLPDDSVAIKIAKFARDTDFKTEIYPMAADIQMIIGYNLGAEGFKNRRKIVDLLSEGRFEDPWFDTQIQELKNWINEESRYAIQHASCININEFGDVYIAYAKIGGGRITQILEKEYPDSQAYIGIDLRYNEIIIHSKNVQCREFARYFSGGGHEDRAGFKHPQTFNEDLQLSDKFIEDITKILPKFKK